MMKNLLISKNHHIQGYHFDILQKVSNFNCILISTNFFKFYTNNKINQSNFNIENINTDRQNLFSLNKRYFSTIDKIKIKSRIRLVDVLDSMEDSIDYATEQLQFYLSKENFKSFIDDFDNYSRKGLIFDTNAINNFLSASYKKNNKIVEIIQEYVLEKNLKFDSIGYCYIILATLRNKGFEKAYSLFIEGSILGIQQNLSVIISLLGEIISKNEDRNSLNFIMHHLQKYYTDEIVNDIKDLFKIELENFNKESTEELAPFKLPSNSRKYPSRSNRQPNKSISPKLKTNEKNLTEKTKSEKNFNSKNENKETSIKKDKNLKQDGITKKLKNQNNKNTKEKNKNELLILNDNKKENNDTKKDKNSLEFQLEEILLKIMEQNYFASKELTDKKGNFSSNEPKLSKKENKDKKDLSKKGNESSIGLDDDPLKELFGKGKIMIVSLKTANFNDDSSSDERE